MGYWWGGGKRQERKLIGSLELVKIQPLKCVPDVAHSTGSRRASVDSRRQKSAGSYSAGDSTDEFFPSS